MLENPFLLSLVTAFGFGGWPLVARAAGMPPLGIAVILSIGTLASVSTVGPFLFSWDAVTRKMIYLGLLAGAINGVSFLAYSKLVATPAWDISIYVPLSIALMLIVPAVGGSVFFGESFSITKALGVGAILVGVYLLR